MALPELNGAVGYSFGLEIDGVVIKHIQEVSGLKMEQDSIEMKANSNDGKYINKQLPGRPKLAGSLTLTRALTADNSFEKWVKAAHFGKMDDARKGGALIVYDYEGSAIKHYKLTSAWPKTLELGNMKAGDTTILTEKLTLVYEELQPE